MKHHDRFTRELFFLFYFLFFGTTFLYKISPNQIFYYLNCIAEYTYIPGIFFAAGYQIRSLRNIYPDQDDFRGILLKKSVIWILHFYLIGFLKEVFLDGRDLFPTIKDLLALLRLPGISTIFISLFFLYLMAAFFYIPVMEGEYRKWIIPAVSLLGFLLVFLPEGIIGYGSIGIFTGADNYGAAPILPYLFFIFFGANMAEKTDLHPAEKNNLISALILLILGGGLIVLHMKNPALTVLGTLLAWISILICRLFYFIYEKIEITLWNLFINCKKRILAFYHKKQEKKLFRSIFYLIGYTGLFAVICFLIFFPYIHAHRTLIWGPDGLGQYIPKIYQFVNNIPAVLKDILHGNMNFKQYDFSIGLGSTMIVSFDPIYWIYLLVHPSQIETTYSAIIILRYWLAGLSFSSMIFFFGGSRYKAYLTSMMYVFSGYAIYAGTKHGQFITPMIFLPMLVIAMEKLITQKKWYMMSVCVALALLSSYYFLYMHTIAIGIYFVVRILCTKKYRNFKTFFTRGLIITGSYILGAGMGILSIFTQFAAYMGSSRTEGTNIDGFISRTGLFYRPEWISDTFISYISDSYTSGLWLKLGFAPIVFLALVLLFTRKNKKELKPLFFIGTLFCIIPVAGYVFSGFSSVNNRWCYIYACLITFIFAELVDYLPKLTGKELKIMAIMTFLYGGIILCSTKYHTDKVFGAFGLLTVTLIVLFMINQKQTFFPKASVKSVIFVLTMITLILNANIFIAATSETGTHLDIYTKAGTSKKQITYCALNYLDEVVDDDEEFYRATNLKTLGNNRSASLILGYNDISTFTSTLGSGVVDYNSAMGNCGWNIVSVYSYNCRTILNELASVKYIGTFSHAQACMPYGYHEVYRKNSSKKTWYIYENEYALPLGYTYDNILSSEEASKYNAAEKQDLTMTTAIVNNDKGVDNSNLNSSKKLPLSVHELDITDVDTSGSVTIDEESGMITVTAGSTLTFHFKGEKNAETYLSFAGDIYHEKDATEHFLKTGVSAEGTNFEYKFRIDSYTTGQDEYLFNLGYHEKSIDSCTLTFKADGILHYNDIAIYSQPMDNYADEVAALKENSLTNVVTDTNRVEGDISLDSDKMLCITLPYQTGWTAYVDGEKVPIERINYQYMGLNLTAGQHHIELHYQIPHISYAFLIMAGSIAVFLLIILFNFIRKRARK